jgi:hypothetical protein
MSGNAILQGRIELKRPANLRGRLKETLNALRAIRIVDGNRLVLVDADLPLAPNEMLMRPSIAALQLYLYNDTRYNVEYIARPTDVEYIADFYTSLVAASRAVNDFEDAEGEARLLVEPLFQYEYPEIYLALVNLLIQSSEGLKPALHNRQTMLDAYERLSSTAEMQRRLNAIERDAVELRSQLTTGGLLDEQLRAERTLAFVRAVRDDVLPAWRKSLVRPRVVKIEKLEERQEQDDEDDNNNQITPVVEQTAVTVAPRARPIAEEDNAEMSMAPPPPRDPADKITRRSQRERRPPSGRK